MSNDMYEVSGNQDSVYLRSTIRPPFEPRGPLLAMRSDVRTKLHEMNRPRDRLYARYSSAIRRLSDAENVLFYNIGTAHFQGLGTSCLTFERSFSQPRGTYPHESFYTTTDEVEQVWTMESQVASWDLTSLNVSQSKSLVARAWLAMRTASSPQMHNLLDAPIYGLRVTIETTRSVDIVGKVKPLLDGLISGMHSYAGSRLEAVAYRLALSLGAEQRETEELLTRTAGSPLGPREVLWPFGSGVQWNPADDACVHATVEQHASNSHGVHVELFRVLGR